MGFKSKVFVQPGIATVIKSKQLRALVLDQAKSLGLKFVNKEDSERFNDGDAIAWFANGLMVLSSTYYEDSLTLISNEEFMEKLVAFSEEIKPIVKPLEFWSNGFEFKYITITDYYNQTIMLTDKYQSELGKFFFSTIDKLKEVIDKGDE